MIGHGSFGVVFKTTIKETNEECAIKRVLQDKRYKNRELQIMQLLHHRNIVDLKYFFLNVNEKDELYLNLILEFVPTTIFEASHFYISKKTSMPIFEIKLYMYQLLRALNYIHKDSICHRDLKPQNLLVNPETGVLKLCDFGSAKVLVESQPNISYICSRYYRAPELIFGASNYTTKIDIWSVGCILAELIIGRPIFAGESGVDQLVEIIKVKGTPLKIEVKAMNPDYKDQKFPIIKPIPLHKVLNSTRSFAYTDDMKAVNDLDSVVEVLSKMLDYKPTTRIDALNGMTEEFFNDLRDINVKLPEFKSQIMNKTEKTTYKSMPELFDFSEDELKSQPSLRNILIPQWARKEKA